MKILKEGRDSKANPLTGTIINCINCNCSFQFEKEDPIPRIVADQRDGDYYEIFCPKCKSLNSMNVTHNR